jgi:hypothetical protein
MIEHPTYANTTKQRGLVTPKFRVVCTLLYHCLTYILVASRSRFGFRVAAWQRYPLLTYAPAQPMFVVVSASCKRPRGRCMFDTGMHGCAVKISAVDFVLEFKFLQRTRSEFDLQNQKL